MKIKWFALGVGFLMLALLSGLVPMFRVDASHAAAGNVPYVITTLPVGKHPKGIAVNWSTNRVYVAMFDASCIQTVNGHDLTLETCAYSQGLHPNQLSLFGFDKLYVTNRDSNSISLLDANTLQVLHWIPTGKLPWSVIAANDKVFVGNFDSSNISVFDLQLDHLLATIPLPDDAPALMTFGYWGVYVPGWKTGALYAINTQDNSLTNPVSIKPGAFAVAENQYTREIFVTNRLENTLDVFAKDGFVPLKTIRLPGPPYAIAVNPKTNHLFVVDALNDVVDVLDTSTGQLLTTLHVGRQDQEQGGQGLALNLETNRVYVSNYADDSLTVIQDLYPNATPTPSPTATPTPPSSNCALQPSAPILLSPANGAQIQFGPVKVDWQETQCADHYKLMVLESPPRHKYMRINLSETEYTFSGLNREMRYTWKVRACNAFGCSGAHKRSFTLIP